MWMKKHLAPLVILAVAIILPFIFRDAYSRQLLVLICVYAALALSLDIIIGYMGQISLGHIAFFGIGAYTSALLSLKLGMPVWLGWLAAIVCGGIIGYIIGYVSLRRTRGVSLAIVTFGVGFVIYLVSQNWYQLTNGFEGLIGIPSPVLAIPGLPRFTFESSFSYYYLVLAILVFTVYLISAVLRSRFGRAVVALRENEELASSVGINAFNYYVLAFTLASALAALVGATYGHYVRIVTPRLLGMDYMLMLLIMVVVGGKGTLAGPILGAAIFILVPEWLRMTAQLRLVLLGGIFLVCIIFMPQGIYPALVSLFKRASLSGRLWLSKVRGGKTF